MQPCLDRVIDVDLAVKLSESMQVKDQAISPTNVTNFIQRWITHCDNMKNPTLLEKIIPIEILADKENVTRDRTWCTKAKFLEFEAIVPKMAINFICDQLPTTHADVETLHLVIKNEITKKGHALQRGNTGTPHVPPPMVTDSWEKKVEWIKHHLKKEYDSGYVTKFTKLWMVDIQTLLFFMSHGFYWLPRKHPTAALQKFLQNAGAINQKWIKEGEPPATYFYPNPLADCISCSAHDLWKDDQSLNHFFIAKDKVQVLFIFFCMSLARQEQN